MREDFVVFVVSHMTWIAVGAIVMAHLAFAYEGYPFAARLLLAVPAVIALLEGRAYLRSGVRELPIGLWALAQFYIIYGFPVFFDLPFFDLAGPVHFSDESRIVAGMVVALGALSAWVGIRLGLASGQRIHGFMLRAVPPAQLPSQWENAFIVYAVLATAADLFAKKFGVPQAVALPLQVILGLDCALGLTLALPSRRFGGYSAPIVAVIVGFLGVLGGMLDPVLRTGATYMAGVWLNTRRFAFRTLVICCAVYAILQPAKDMYRRQTWGASEQVSLAGRMTNWEHAVEDHDDPRRKTDNLDALASRIDQLDPVMNVVQVVPNRIDYIMGASMVEALYMPIPRILWRDKPTNKEQMQQRYAVIFGQQTEEGARTTNIGLPMLVEGWWNFGWAGVVMVSLLLGLWSGAAQRAFAGEHWAMRALGYCYFAQTGTMAAFIQTYGTIFQSFVGHLIAVWAVFGLATLLSGRERRAPMAGGREGRPTPVRALLAQRAGPRSVPLGRV